MQNDDWRAMFQWILHHSCGGKSVKFPDNGKVGISAKSLGLDMFTDRNPITFWWLLLPTKSGMMSADCLNTRSKKVLTNVAAFAGKACIMSCE